MTPDKSGGTAFPFVKYRRNNGGHSAIYEVCHESSGMTMRQFYKAAALQGMLATIPDARWPVAEKLAISVGQYADALLAEDAAHNSKQP